MATAKKVVKKVKEVAKKIVKKKPIVKKEEPKVVEIVPVICTDCGGRGLQDANTLCSSCKGHGKI